VSVRLSVPSDRWCGFVIGPAARRYPTIAAQLVVSNGHAIARQTAANVGSATLSAAIGS